jgi:hypothetical protein
MAQQGMPPPFPGIAPPGAPPLGMMPPQMGIPPPKLMGGIPTPRQPPNTTPSRTVYVNNINEKVQIPGKNRNSKHDINGSCF